MSNLDISKVILDLAIILFATKVLGLLARRLGLPQVVGAVVAGLLIGPAIWGGWAPVNPSGAEKNFLAGIAEIGVIMILFSAGLETDLKELRRSGLVSTVIAMGGVLVPIGLGILVAIGFLGGFAAAAADSAVLLDAIFIGIILAATSVGITVETLKEMGKLSGRVGTTILSAAIIDDVIGIMVLSVVIGFKNPDANAGMTILMTVLFFVAAIAVGVGLNYLFRWLVKRYPHRRRVPIFGLVVCFFYAFAAEKWFGIADITGAYVAGIVLSNLKDTTYIDRKIDINSYMIFSPVFFANIGINTSFAGFDWNLLLFALCFVAAGILGKILGCGGMARLCRFSNRDSFKVGVGMIARGEVALVVCNKGIANGLFDVAATGIDPVIPVIFLVILSSLLAPILLKLAYRKDPSPVGMAPDVQLSMFPEARAMAGESQSDGGRCVPVGENPAENVSPNLNGPGNGENNGNGPENS